MDALGARAYEIGAKTKSSDSENASAMEYMTMAGWKTEDMPDSIEGIIKLTTVSGEKNAMTTDLPGYCEQIGLVCNLTIHGIQHE